MNEESVIQDIIDLYNRYEVNIEYFSEWGKEDTIKGMKGILANLDQKRRKEYVYTDLVLIKKIYSKYC